MTSRSPTTEALITRYISLLSEFTSQAQRLHIQQVESRSSSSSSSTTSSPPTSPSESDTYFSYPPLTQYTSSSSSSTSESSMDQVSSEELLSNLTRQIKATLTSILNVPSVKRDPELRSWTQERLMEVEKEMRRMRRRRSSLGYAGLSATLSRSATADSV